MLADSEGICHPETRTLCVERLGEVEYGCMLAQQEARHAQVASGQASDTLFLLSHPPVITTGRHAAATHLRVSRHSLQARGIAYHQTGRGGDITYHGPGQLVGYPILGLLPHEQDLRGYVTKLEEILIRCASDFGVRALRVAGLRGIWVGCDKLAAIGVRLSRWVTMHGFALNVWTSLDNFGLIVPCGLQDKGVTSLQKLLGTAPSWDAVSQSITYHSYAVLQRRPGPQLFCTGGA